MKESLGTMKPVSMEERSGYRHRYLKLSFYEYEAVERSFFILFSRKIAEVAKVTSILLTENTMFLT